jgi:hypothetical protein
MANEPKLRKKNIEDYEDRVTVLEGGTPESHSGTITKKEIENLEDRVTTLEGGTVRPHHNTMRIEEVIGLGGRIEDLEDAPTKFTITYDVNGGEGSIDSVEVTEGESITLDDGSKITPPTDKTFDGWTTTKDDDNTKVSSPYTPDADITLYAYYIEA